MLGAIAGDIVGSVYEGGQPPGKDFPLFGPASRFTDDTVLTVAVAHAVRGNHGYGVSLRHWGQRYPKAGYGRWFRDWLGQDDAPPYNSFGNGSAMRVAPIGWAYESLDQVLHQAARSAEPTHNHPEGIKGAQAVAAAVFLGRTGHSKDDIAALMSGRFGYNVTANLGTLQNAGGIDVT